MQSGESSAVKRDTKKDVLGERREVAADSRKCPRISKSVSKRNISEFFEWDRGGNTDEYVHGSVYSRLSQIRKRGSIVVGNGQTGGGASSIIDSMNGMNSMQSASTCATKIVNNNLEFSTANILHEGSVVHPAASQKTVSCGHGISEVSYNENSDVNVMDFCTSNACSIKEGKAEVDEWGRNLSQEGLSASRVSKGSGSAVVNRERRPNEVEDDASSPEKKTQKIIRRLDAPGCSTALRFRFGEQIERMGGQSGALRNGSSPRLPQREDERSGSFAGSDPSDNGEDAFADEEYSSCSEYSPPPYPQDLDWEE